MAEQTNRNQALVQQVQDALALNDLRQVRACLECLHPSEIADLLESLPSAVREALWLHIDARLEGDVLSHSNSAVRAGLLEHMDPAQVAAATRDLDSDDLADILQDLPDPVAGAVLRSMDAARREAVSSVLTHAPDTAGGLMNLDVVTVRSDVDVETVLGELRAHPALPANTDQLMVVDQRNTYLGVLRLAELVTAAPGAIVGEIMSISEHGIPASTPVGEVALRFEQRDLLSAPVVDSEGLLVGRITVDDVVDVIREESERSIRSAAGLDDDTDIFAPILVAARARALWLAVNLATAFLAAWVIGRFEATIAELVALAVLMPVVASMGGIAGGQTLTIVVRGLALGQVGNANARSVLWRELAVGCLNGALWALVVAAIAALWFRSGSLGLVLGAAMVINLVTAALAGVLIPLILRRMAIDPALAGGVVLTTVTDVVGFLAFLGLATQFLL